MPCALSPASLNCLESSMTDSNFITSIILVPGITAALLFGVFTYLYRQSREAFFRIWQLAWAAYTVSYALQGIYYSGLSDGILIGTAGKLLFYSVPFLIYVSTDTLRGRQFLWRPLHLGIAAALVLWVLWTVPFTMRSEAAMVHIGGHPISASPDIAAFVLLSIAAWKFLAAGRKQRSTGYKMLSASVFLWGLLLLAREFHSIMEIVFANVGHFLGPIPQMLMGIAMMMVLYESDRSNVQENLLAFSNLEIDFSRVLSTEELSPSMHKLLDRLIRLAHTDRAFLYVLEPFRSVLPSSQVGFGESFLQTVEAQVGASMASVLKIQSRDSQAQLQSIPISVLRSQADPHLVNLGELLAESGNTSLTALAIATPDREVGVLILPNRRETSFSGSQRGLLVSLAMQMGTTLEKYALLNEAQRRTKEFQMLTEIGQAISARLHQDEVFSAVHKELTRLMDTTTFYIAFLDGDELRFEFESEDGVLLPKRSRKVINGFSEHMIRTGEALLIEADLEPVRDRLGVVAIARPAKCFCGVPIVIGSKPLGVMAALHY